ncbi:RNA-binding protein 5-like protein [Leishmania tarentolae]|uniref:RNA-binding protein 5-like protein n=1 Tax=Leishmania tarentolae TaxID=5689 RepID=A0A640KFH2_LEITA|nr:RNA-binding protein 5-like protein [Leishmania tarentolae]
MMHPQPAAQPVNDDMLKQSRNVYVASLPLSFDDQQLMDLFSPYGRIVSARIMRAKKSHASKGYGFVMFHEVNSAEKSIEGLHGRIVDGSRIQVRRANADASMTFNKVLHTAVGLHRTPPKQSNSSTSALQCTSPDASVQHLLYSAALSQAATGLYAAQPPTSPYAIVAPRTYQGQNPTPVAINQSYGAIMNSHVLQASNGGIGAPYLSHMQPHQVPVQAVQQQQQPVYVVLLPNGQHIIPPNQFSM